MKYDFYYQSIDNYESMKGKKPEAIIISKIEFDQVIKAFGTIRPIQSFTIGEVIAMPSLDVHEGECFLIP